MIPTAQYLRTGSPPDEDAEAREARMIDEARASLGKAAGWLGKLIGAAETPAVRREAEDALEGVQALIHDHIDPARYVVECRMADAQQGQYEADRRRDLAAYHGSVL